MLVKPALNHPNVENEREEPGCRRHGPQTNGVLKSNEEKVLVRSHAETFSDKKTWWKDS